MEHAFQQCQALKPDIDRLKRDSNLWDGRAAALQGIIVSIMSLEETRGQLRQHEPCAADLAGNILDFLFQILFEVLGPEIELADTDY